MKCDLDSSMLMLTLTALDDLYLAGGGHRFNVETQPLQRVLDLPWCLLSHGRA